VRARSAPHSSASRTGRACRTLPFGTGSASWADAKTKAPLRRIRPRVAPEGFAPLADTNGSTGARRGHHPRTPADPVCGPRHRRPPDAGPPGAGAATDEWTAVLPGGAAPGTGRADRFRDLYAQPRLPVVVGALNRQARERGPLFGWAVAWRRNGSVRMRCSASTCGSQLVISPYDGLEARDYRRFLTVLLRRGRVEVTSARPRRPAQPRNDEPPSVVAPFIRSRARFRTFARRSCGPNV
jgi:hypothetical protein